MHYFGFHRLWILIFVIFQCATLLATGYLPAQTHSPTLLFYFSCVFVKKTQKRQWLPPPSQWQMLQYSVLTLKTLMSFSLSSPTVLFRHKAACDAATCRLRLCGTKIHSIPFTHLTFCRKGRIWTCFYFVVASSDCAHNQRCYREFKYVCKRYKNAVQCTDHIQMCRSGHHNHNLIRVFVDGCGRGRGEGT